MERESRLARVVDQLRRRLEQQQAENEQLEDLLRQADASLTGARPPCCIVAMMSNHLARMSFPQCKCRSGAVDQTWTILVLQCLDFQ